MSTYHINKSGKCRAKITHDDTLKIARKIGVEWDQVLFKPIDLQRGMKIELEHGKCLENEPSPKTNVTNSDLGKTGKITLAHLEEDFRYYDLKIGLPAMEKKLKSTKTKAVKKAKQEKSKK